jgi:hypothetical protein
MGSAAKLMVEGAGMAAAVVILGVWAGAQQRFESQLEAGAPTPAQVHTAAHQRSAAELAARAEEALLRGDEAQALRGYQATLSIDPHHAEAGLREVELLMSAGDDDAALRALMPRQLLMLPGSEEHARALCLEAGARMALEPERAAAVAQRACEAGAEACCDPFAME